MKTMKPASRRNFLVAASLGGAGALAAVTTARKAKTLEADRPAPEPRKGYRATEHVLKYYKTTEV